MYRKQTNFLVALVLAAAVSLPVAAANASPPTQQIEIPSWLERIQYPGTSSEPTVYVNGPIAIPAWLTRINYPGTSSQPTVYVATPTTASSDGPFDWGSAAVGAGFVAGISLIVAGLVLALRRRHRLAHA